LGSKFNIAIWGKSFTVLWTTLPTICFHMSRNFDWWICKCKAVLYYYAIIGRAMVWLVKVLKVPKSSLAVSKAIETEGEERPICEGEWSSCHRSFQLSNNLSVRSCLEQGHKFN
jgi:hypothetical protein